MTNTDTSVRSTIARLNDHFRRHPGADWMVTAAVQAKGPIFVLAATSAVRCFDAFTTDNDPHGEHDFGAFDLGGERLFWKIDYYDKDLRFGSEDPADPAVTRRVLTVMLASEY
jgi:hypothetical protein